MQNCERVVFISTISAELIDMAETIRQFREDGIAYHVRGEVTGLLLYGDSYIFHCFESRHGEMDKLKRDLLAYPYHHNQRLIYHKTNTESRFNSWSMIYVVTEPRIQDFIEKHNWNRFDPYLLQGELLDEFMNVIYSYSDIRKTAFTQLNDRLTKHERAVSSVNRLTYLIIALAIALIASLVTYGLDYFKLGFNAR